MSRKYQIVPTNRKTLFLRNIEFLLLNRNLMREEDIKIFRNDVCNEILKILNSYEFDVINDSNFYMNDIYQQHSSFLRFIVNRKCVSTLE